MPRQRRKPGLQVYGTILGRGRYGRRYVRSGTGGPVTTRMGKRGGRRFANRRIGRRRYTAKRNKTYKRKRVKAARKVTRNAVTSALSEGRKLTAFYGQQNTATGYTSGGQGGTYFTTESVGTGVTTKDDVPTRVLDDVHHLLNIADNVWPVTPAFDNATASNFGKVKLKSRLTYTLRNQSNETANIKCYYCKVRKDTNWTQVNTNTFAGDKASIYTVLGYGFAQSDLLPAQQTGDNVVLNEVHWTPFESKAFVENFLIQKVKRIKLAPGEDTNVVIKKPWHHFKPEKLVNMDAGSVAHDWASTAMTRKYAWIRGAKFILFNLESRIAGIAGQATYQKNITYTTPTVIMQSAFEYHAKFHSITPSKAKLLLATSGIASGTASIIIDADEQKGAEIDAS